MNFLLLFLVLWAVASAVLGVAIGKAIARRETLDARLEPYVASELDERTAASPNTWIGFSRRGGR